MRRLQRRAAQRRRWELALLALAVGHWAYHKNREWDLVVKDLVAIRGWQSDLDALDDAGPSTTAPPDTIRPHARGRGGPGRPSLNHLALRT